MAKGTFGFDDFLKQMQSLRKMGGMSSMLKLLPGMGALKDMDFDDREINKIEGIVHSMTTAERTDPDILDSSRRRRIARGCGRDVQDVAGLVKTFKRSREMMRTMAGGGGMGMGALKNMFSGGAGDMMSAMAGGGMRKVKQRSKRKRQPRKKNKRR
jgi:signal recognition particle subunit SRP54